jgi:hypothetical protein
MTPSLFGALCNSSSFSSLMEFFNLTDVLVLWRGSFCFLTHFSFVYVIRFCLFVFCRSVAF